MAEFPASPIPAAEFFERFLPRAFAEAELPEELRRAELCLGVRLEGRGGGEWLVRLRDGELRVEPGTRDGASVSVVQSVADWRGALWEGRGGEVGRQAAALFRPGARVPSRVGDLVAPAVAAFAQAEGLDGLVQVRVQDGGDADWALGLKLGPGAVPRAPTTTVSLRADDVDAMLRGELGPLEAFLGGRIQVQGDVALLMQLQALQMQAALARPGPGDRERG
jgi:hypothetical protein